jgi:mannose-6-phosphate isomerase-like protein (cupin superfamily)
MSYSEWIASHHIYPIIKVEGLESNLNIKADTIHLFYNQKSRYSFNWHTDLVNVRLHVVKGRKVLKVKDKTHTLYPGQTAFIPKGHLHRAYSDSGTWALSISD